MYTGSCKSFATAITLPYRSRVFCKNALRTVMQWRRQTSTRPWVCAIPTIQCGWINMQENTRFVNEHICDDCEETRETNLNESSTHIFEFVVKNTHERTRLRWLKKPKNTNLFTLACARCKLCVCVLDQNWVDMVNNNMDHTLGMKICGHIH